MLGMTKRKEKERKREIVGEKEGTVKTNGQFFIYIINRSACFFYVSFLIFTLFFIFMFSILFEDGFNGAHVYVCCVQGFRRGVFAFGEGYKRSDDIMNMFAHEPALA